MRNSMLLVMAVVLFGVPLSACAQELPSLDRLDGDPVRTLLPPDAIPAIDQPAFVTAAEAGFMDDEEPVIGVVHNGVAKAYSIWHLDRHEIVNDSFAGDPLAVTW